MTTRYARLSARSRRLEVVAAVAAVVFTVAMCRLVPGEAETLAAGATRAGDGQGAGPRTVSPSPDRPEALPRAEPVRVVIRGTGVDAEVVASEVPGANGFPVAPPDDAMRVAWAAGGPAPGQDGAAVLIGHLDSEGGAAAFAGLGGLHTGAEIRVGRANDRTARFEVYAVQRYGAAGPPGELADGPADSGAQLRLVAMGGAWTASIADDTSIVAFAHLR